MKKKRKGSSTTALLLMLTPKHTSCRTHDGTNEQKSSQLSKQSTDYFRIISTLLLLHIHTNKLSLENQIRGLNNKVS
jgi:hypothetical protein